MAKKKQQKLPENIADVTSKPSEPGSDARTQDGGATAGTLGQRLRRAREQRHVSLREISDHTRISMRHLEAIEADDFKALPGGIFNRSFVKAYARQVGFDEREALELYARTAREHGESPDEMPTSPVRSRVYMDGESQRSPFVTALLSLLMLGVLILVVYGGLHYYRRQESGPQAADANAPAAQPSAPAQQTPAPPPAPPADGLQIQVRAKGEDVWVGTRVDEEKSSDGTIKANETKEFKPQNSLALRFSKDKVNALEVSVNGQVAQVPPPNPKAKGIEWVITKENYKQFLP